MSDAATDSNIEKKSVQEVPRPNNLVPPELHGPEGLSKQGTGDRPNVVRNGQVVFSKLDGYDGNAKFDENGNPKDGAQDAATDAVKEGKDTRKDASDSSSGDTKKALDSYSKTLERAGYSEREAKELTNKTFANFEKQERKDVHDGTDAHLKGTAVEQMKRLDKASQNILDKNGVQIDSQGNRTLKDGQKDYLSDHDRQNMVRDLANRFADPKENVVQGKHFTCALESMQKQLIQGGDPAALAESVSSMVNTGKAQIHDRQGKTRTVEVDSRSWAPDAESAKNFQSSFGANDIRGGFGQACDALTGQVMADRKAERQGLPSSANGLENATYKYMTAHADSIDPSAKTQTGEGLFAKGRDGQYRIEHAMGSDGKMQAVDSPGAGLWDVADTNRAMGGAEGAIFAHRNFAGVGRPPAGEGYPSDLRISTFGSEAELSQKLTEFERKNGQSAQLLVDAPYLPGGGQAGHGLHVLNLSMNADGKTYDIDNNWSQGQDLEKVGYAAIDKSTNPNNWQSEGRPNQESIIRPGTGRDPSETDNDFRHRRDRELEAERKQKEQEDERKRKEAEAREKEKEREEHERREKERLRKEEAEKKQTEDEARKIATQQAELDAALAQWNFYQLRVPTIAA